ncbi:MAG: hypothetical protein ABSD58_03155 [Verrucomicrobiia bacterium]|jgi:hypothetical protein
MKRILILCLLFVIPSLSRDLFAANDYNWRIIVAPQTGDVEQVVLDPSQWSLTLTNFPTGVRRATLEFTGSGGSYTQTVVQAAGSGCIDVTYISGSATYIIGVDTNCLVNAGLANTGDLTTLSNYLASAFAGSGVTNGLATVVFVDNLSNYLAGVIASSGSVLVPEPGVLLTSQGAGTNGIGADFSLVVSNQMTGVQLNGGPVVSTGDTTDFYPLAGNPAGYLTSVGGYTNGNVVAPGYMITMASAGANTQIVSATSSTVNAQSNNTYATGTTQYLYHLNVGGSETVSNNLTVLEQIMDSGSLTVSSGGTISGGLLVNGGEIINGTATLSGNATVGTNLTVGGNASIGGSLTSGNLAGGTGYLAANLSGLLGTNQITWPLAGNSGTFGAANTFIVLHLNNGVIDSIATATGPASGVSTNAVSAIENANNGTWWNNVLALILTNFSDIGVNGQTNIVGFNNAPFETVQLFQGGTNFTVHGATLSFTNASTQGLGFALTNGGTLTVSGTISNLVTASNHAGNTNQYFGIGTNSVRGSGYSGLDIQTYSPNSIDTMWDLNVGGGANSAEDMGFNNYLNQVNYNLASYSSQYEQDFWIGLGVAQFGVFEWRPQFGHVGISYQPLQTPSGGPGTYTADKTLTIDCGTIWTAAEGAYTSYTIGSGIVIDQLDADAEHWWYFGNNTNDFGVTVKEGAVRAGYNCTNKIQNSDWVRLAVFDNGTWPAIGYLGVASNIDIAGIFFTTGCSSNTATDGFSSPATDARRIKTNTFVGFLSNRNGNFGSSTTNLAAILFRDETNGLEVLSVSTNNGESVWLGPTNNLQQTMLSDVIQATNEQWRVINGVTNWWYVGNAGTGTIP